MSVEITLQQRLDMEEEIKIRILMERTNQYIEDHAQRLLGINGHNRNTKLCKSLTSGKKCEHKVCYFAHSLEELKKTPCNFGFNCYLVSRVKFNRYENCSHKVCRYIHPNESNESYASRLNLEYNVQIKVPHEIFMECLEILASKRIKNFMLCVLKKDEYILKSPQFLKDDITNLLIEKQLSQYHF